MGERRRVLRARRRSKLEKSHSAWPFFVEPDGGVHSKSERKIRGGRQPSRGRQDGMHQLTLYQVLVKTSGNRNNLLGSKGDAEKKGAKVGEHQHPARKDYPTLRFFTRKKRCKDIKHLQKQKTGTTEIWTEEINSGIRHHVQNSGVIQRYEARKLGLILRRKQQRVETVIRMVQGKQLPGSTSKSEEQKKNARRMAS